MNSEWMEESKEEKGAAGGNERWWCPSARQLKPIPAAYQCPPKRQCVPEWLFMTKEESGIWKQKETDLNLKGNKDMCEAQKFPRETMRP